MWLLPGLRTRTAPSKDVEWTEQAGRRRRLQVLLDSLPFQTSLLIVVIVYALIIFIDLGANELVFAGGCDIKSQCARPSGGCAAWLDTFRCLDSIFLTLFALEIAASLYAFGLWYLKDWVTSFDAVIVLVSLGFLIWKSTSSDCDNLAASTANDVSTAARLIRILTVLRLLTVMNKVTHTRQNAKMMRQKARRPPRV